MNPIYRFFLKKDNNQRVLVRPVYSDELSINWERESGEYFHRRKLSGKLTFIGPDYDIIMPTPQAFGNTFVLDLEISYNNGTDWSSYWQGIFYHTDCEIDFDNKEVTVTPQPRDEYTELLAAMEKEYNLIDLAPRVERINLKKRPVTQIYIAGQPKISCFLGGMYWEQDCTPESNYSALANHYHFTRMDIVVFVEIKQQGSPVLPDFIGVLGTDYTILTKGDFELRSESGYIYIRRISTDSRLWQAQGAYLEGEVTLTPVPDSEAQGEVKIYSTLSAVYMRAVTDVLSVDGVATEPIPDDDIVIDHRNYHRIAKLNIPRLLWFTDYLNDEPTKWGEYENQLYYDPGLPGSSGLDALPIARSQWDRVSFWYLTSFVDDLLESKMTTDISLRDAYTLTNVIELLLQKNKTGLGLSTLFLGDNDPVTYDERTYCITPKSNVKKIDYDIPATKAPITLKTVLDMLKSVFKCYWYISDSNLKIEHVKYFLNGGSYDDLPQVEIDLTELTNTRNGKPLDYIQNKVKYDKSDMAARFEFGWMDDVTLPFDGEPINVVNNYVNKDKIEKIIVSEFTSDIDYILSDPAAISDDGFVLMGVQTAQDGLYVPIARITPMNVVIQNPYCAFVFCQKYYTYDFPGYVYKIGDNEEETPHGRIKAKNQEVNFPCYTDPDIQKLIKTSIGAGQIENLDINLSSRNGKATLKFEI